MKQLKEDEKCCKIPFNKKTQLRIGPNLYILKLYFCNHL